MVNEIIFAILVGVVIVAFVAAGYRLNKGHGPVSALIWFVLTLALGGIGTFLLFLLYASLYYAGGGH